MSIAELLAALTEETPNTLVIQKSQTPPFYEGEVCYARSTKKDIALCREASSIIQTKWPKGLSVQERFTCQQLKLGKTDSGTLYVWAVIIPGSDLCDEVAFGLFARKNDQEKFEYECILDN
jgi:hypothetical protein